MPACALSRGSWIVSSSGRLSSDWRGILKSSSSPLIDVCHALYGETVALGLAGSDMIAVLRAIEARDGTIA